MVYVTHDQGEALTMSDRIAVFSDGRIRQLATPFEVYESPPMPSSRASSARTTGSTARWQPTTAPGCWWMSRAG